MKLRRETLTKTYLEDKVVVETILTYEYADEEEKQKHSIEMQNKGYCDTEAYKVNQGDLHNPDYVLIGVYTLNYDFKKCTK